jgi:hypothetical protein
MSNSLCDRLQTMELHVILMTEVLIHWKIHVEYPAVSVIAKLSPDTAVEMRSIRTRATASTGGSKPRLYCHRSTQYIVHLCRRRHSCQRGTHTIALLCLVCLLCLLC